MATHQNILVDAKTFGTWWVKKRWFRTSPLASSARFAVNSEKPWYTIPCERQKARTERSQPVRA